MNTSLFITIIGLLFLLLFSFLLFIFIILRRIVLKKKEIRFSRQYQQIEKDVLEAVSALDANLANEIALKYRHQPAVLTRVLLDFGAVIKGEGWDLLKVIFDLTLKEKCLKDIYSRRTIRRLRGARLYALFLDSSGSPHLLKLLQDKPIVKLTAINALTRIPTPETLVFLFQAFAQDTGPAVRSYFNIMFGLGAKIEKLVEEYLKKPLPAEKLALLVELVGAIPLRPLYENIVSFKDHPDKEIRIRLAKSLGKLLHPDSFSVLLELSADKAWEVQAQAIKGLGRLKNPEALSTLRKALFSPFWYVRFNGGHGLADLGEEGIFCLRGVAAQKEDKYASDMAIMVLNEIIYAEQAA